MASDSLKATLASVCTDVAYGYTESASSEKVGPHFLRITDIQDGVVNWDEVPYCPISKEHLDKYRLERGDIVVARTGNSTGENYLFDCGEDAVFASYLIRFRVDHAKADAHFVWYSMRAPRWWSFVEGAKTGSAQAGANAKILGQFSLTLPPLLEQKAIASILGALDDKIELNRRMNATLEATARAIFKSWFVDFDPVRAKMDGRQPAGMSADLAALFPDSLEHVDGELVPKGWKPKRWGELSTLEYGKSLRDYKHANGPYDVYGTNGRIGKHDCPLCDSPGIVVGRKGAYRGIHYSPAPFFVIDTAFYLRATTDFELRWAYYELLNFDINNLDSGSAIPSTSRQDFYSIPVLVPRVEVQQAFGRIVESLFARKIANDTESTKLASLRDTLLPKLLSGELRVDDAELAVK